MQDGGSPVWTATEAITWLAFGQPEKAASVEAAAKLPLKPSERSSLLKNEKRKPLLKRGKGGDISHKRQLMRDNRPLTNTAMRSLTLPCGKSSTHCVRDNWRRSGLRVGSEEEGYRVIPRETWFLSWVFRNDRLEPDDAAVMSDWMVARSARDVFYNVRFYQAAVQAIAYERGPSRKRGPKIWGSCPRRNGSDDAGRTRKPA